MQKLYTVPVYWLLSDEFQFILILHKGHSCPADASKEYWIALQWIARRQMRDSEAEGDFFSLCWADVFNLPVSVNSADTDSFYTNLKLISFISHSYYSQNTAGWDV